MKRSLFVLALTVALSIALHAEDKGRCPSLPDKIANLSYAASKTLPAPPSPNQTYAGTVILAAVISDKGYVCDVRVIHSLTKELDSRAIGTVRSWHFQPGKKDRQPVPVIVSMSVDFWLNKNGEVVSSPLTSTQSTPGSPSIPKAGTAKP